MASVPARMRPLLATEIVDESIRLYRRHLTLFLGIGAIAILPATVLQLLIALTTGRQTDFLANSLGSLLSTIVMAAATLVMLGAMIHAASEVWHGREITIGEAYSRGYRRIGAIFGLAVLLVVILLPMLIVFPVAIYFAVCWMLAFQVLLLEKTSVTRALGRSRQLITSGRGYWWRGVGIIILLLIITGIIAALFTIPAAIFGARLWFADPYADLSLPVVILSVLGDAAGRIVTGPISYITLVLLYYDLRIRKEGLDIELAVQEMEASLATSPPAASTAI